MKIIFCSRSCHRDLNPVGNRIRFRNIPAAGNTKFARHVISSARLCHQPFITYKNKQKTKQLKLDLCATFVFVLQSLTISLNHSIKFFVCLVSVLNLFPSVAFQSVSFYFNLQLCTETLRNTEYMSGFLKDTIRVQFLTKCRLRNKKNIFVSYFRLSFFPILTISAFYFSNCQFI